MFGYPEKRRMEMKSLITVSLCLGFYITVIVHPLGWIPIVQHRIVHHLGGRPVDPFVDLFTFCLASALMISTLAMEDVLCFGDDLRFVAPCVFGIGMFRCSCSSSLLALSKLFNSGPMMFFKIGANYVRGGAIAWLDWVWDGLGSPGLSPCFWVCFMLLCSFLFLFVCCSNPVYGFCNISSL
ncbi:hypothetical protein RchiOBHm_Chr4g0436211 [Rosa chinensis]|uniref:Uncharacterized protein n=1 Tax=Rosa chinensis TaxID=74649 RepID=A0A2P6R205_ROSCH|nr:hypothetical protein RchiOBHm_Chr4g0436211 [Rosa chinensis]